MSLLLIKDTIKGLEEFKAGVKSTHNYIVYNKLTTKNELEILIMNLNKTSFETIAFVFEDNGMGQDEIFEELFPKLDVNGNLNMSSEFISFINDFATTYSPQYIDFLACNLLTYQNWNKLFDYLNTISTVRASNDDTGNLANGGDWVLESSNTDVKNYYFDSDIDYWTYLLDVFSSSVNVVTTTETTDNCYSTGYNATGCTGLGTSGVVSVFTKITTAINTKKVKHISLGERNTCFVTTESYGNLYICGKNTYKTLGMSGYLTTDVEYYPVQITYFASNTLHVTKVSCGWKHVLAATSQITNNVYSWGTGSDGRLASNSSADSETPLNIGTYSSNLLTGQKVLEVNATSYNSAFLTDESQNNVYTCGHPQNGMLGTGSGAIKYIPVNVNISNNYAEYIAGSRSNYAVLTDETTDNLYVWGDNSYGQIGDGNLGTDRTTPYNLSIGGKKILRFRYGVHCAIAMTNDSNQNVYVWGDNTYNKLGLNTKDTNPTYDTPQQITLIKDSSDTNITTYEANGVFAGSRNLSLTLSSTTNNLYISGNGANGELGNGVTYSEHPYLKQVSLSAEVDSMNSAPLNCLIKGTKVLTTKGFIAVEDLTNNHYIVEKSGKIYKIKQVWTNKVFGNEDTIPIIIKKDFFGYSLPSRDLVVSSGHAIHLNNSWFNNRFNPQYCERAREYIGKIINYYHIEIDEWLNKSVLVEEGLYVEFYKPSKFIKNKHYREVRENMIINNNKLTLIKRILI